MDLFSGLFILILEISKIMPVCTPQLLDVAQSEPEFQDFGTRMCFVILQNWRLIFGNEIF